jgi:hypothetical protein
MSPQMGMRAKSLSSDHTVCCTKNYALNFAAQLLNERNGDKASRKQRPHTIGPTRYCGKAKYVDDGICRCRSGHHYALRAASKSCAGTGGEKPSGDLPKSLIARCQARGKTVEEIGAAKVACKAITDELDSAKALFAGGRTRRERGHGTRHA